MKVWVIVAVVCALCVAGSVFAADADVDAAAEKESDASKLTGKVTAWDAGKKSVSVQDKAGKAHSFSWGAETKIKGEPAVGKTVRVRYEEGQPLKVLSIREMPDEPSGPRAGHKKQAQATS